MTIMRSLIYLLWFISSAIYLFNGYQTMVYLVGGFWAFIWTFFMPFGLLTLPFWANLIYDFSSTNLWISYLAPVFFYTILGIFNLSDNLSFFGKPKLVELRSGLFVDLKNDLPESGRFKRLAAFVIDYTILYLSINIFNIEWYGSINFDTLEYTNIGIAGGLLNSILVLSIVWFLYFCIIPIISKGSTIGKLIFRTRLYSVEEDAIEIASNKKIILREALRLSCFLLATYGNFLVPGYMTLTGGIYFGLSLSFIFVIMPFILIFGKSKRTLFDSICRTIVAPRSIDFSYEDNMTDFEELYNSSDFKDFTSQYEEE